MARLQAVSPLGHAREAMGKELFENGRLKISEAPSTQVFSIRQSRKRQDATALNDCLKSLGVTAPAKPNGLTGSIGRACAWLEPHAWLVLSEHGLSPGQTAPGLLVTEISDRVCLFKLTGEGARDVIAAGCDPQMIPVGAMARTRFGGMANVIIERHGEHEYRLTLDVSLAAVFAAWLIQAASNQ